MDMTKFSDDNNRDYKNVLSELQRFIGSNQQPLEEELPPPAPSELPEVQRPSHHSSWNQVSSSGERNDAAAGVERPPTQATKPVNNFSGTFSTNGGKQYQGNEFNSGGGPMTF